jgi:hypothetical protein
MRKYSLVIPSRERAKWLMRQRHTTLEATAHLNPMFVVREDDSELEAYRTYTEKFGVTACTYDGTDIYGAAQTYDALINDEIEKGEVEKLIILDDDLSFAMHNPIIGATPMFRLTKPNELTALLEQAADLVSEKMPIMSFTPIMARSQQSIVAFCKPMMMAYVIYVPHFAHYPQYRFWIGKHIEARCDLNLSLRLLCDGFLTSYMATLFVPDNVNNPGGCSVYRDLDCEKASVAFLKETYPNYVRTRMKRGWSGDPNVVREAPVISWRQAFNAGAFKERFGVEASTFKYNLVQQYGKTYAKFVAGLRHEAS